MAEKKTPQLPPAMYIGDGVYVSFDGYNINLAVNDHRNHVIALESEVMEQLIKYYNNTKNQIK